MKKPFLFLTLALLLVAIGTGSFHAYKMYLANKEQYALVRVAESTPEINKLPHYLAIKESLYKQQKIQMKTVNTGSDWEALNAIEKGTADIALVKISSLLYKRTSSLKEEPGITAFASLDQGTSFHLMSKVNKPLDDLTSLENKTVITGLPDSMETVILENSLRDAGVNPYDSVTMITNIPEEIQLGALKAGTGHYLMIDEKHLIPAISKGFFEVKTIKTHFPISVCVTSPRFIKEQPDALQRFTNAIFLAQKWLQYHTPEESVKAVKGIPTISKDSFPMLVKLYYKGGGLSATPVPSLKDLDLLVTMYQRSREIPMTIKAGDLVLEKFAETSVKTVQYIPEDKKPKTGLEKLKFWENDN